MSEENLPEEAEVQKALGTKEYMYLDLNSLRDGIENTIDAINNMFDNRLRGAPSNTLTFRDEDWTKVCYANGGLQYCLEELKKLTEGEWKKLQGIL